MMRTATRDVFRIRTDESFRSARTPMLDARRIRHKIDIILIIDRDNAPRSQSCSACWCCRRAFKKDKRQVAHVTSKNSARRISISIVVHWLCGSRPVNGACRGARMYAMGGDRATDGHTLTNRQSFIGGVRSADNLHARAIVGARCQL
jgi:hypothetical protein